MFKVKRFNGYWLNQEYTKYVAGLEFEDGTTCDYSFVVYDTKWKGVSALFTMPYGNVHINVHYDLREYENNS